jgi:hypothetical protein
MVTIPLTDSTYGHWTGRTIAVFVLLDAMQTTPKIEMQEVKMLRFRDVENLKNPQTKEQIQQLKGKNELTDYYLRERERVDDFMCEIWDDRLGDGEIKPLFVIDNFMFYAEPRHCNINIYRITKKNEAGREINVYEGNDMPLFRLVHAFEFHLAIQQTNRLQYTETSDSWVPFPKHHGLPTEEEITHIESRRWGEVGAERRKLLEFSVRKRKACSEADQYRLLSVMDILSYGNKTFRYETVL